jgi:hypothetical protein
VRKKRRRGRGGEREGERGREGEIDRQRKGANRKRTKWERE